MSFSIKGLVEWFKSHNDGYYPFNLGMTVQGKPVFNDYFGDLKKIRAILESPAVLKVFTLQCDLFSLGKIKIYKDGKDIGAHPILDMLNEPNYMQSQNQWLWDYMFWTMLGTAYLYVDSQVAAPGNNLYFLNPIGMEFPTNMLNKSDKIILSSKSNKDILAFSVKYKFEDGTSMLIPFSKIVCTTDLSNGVGNWFKGNSRLDALHKVITNSEAALDARNINIRYAGKFMVAGQQDPNNVTKIPMSKDEKDDIETKMNGRKSVHAVKSMIEIKRFVEDMRKLELNQAYLDSYFIIGNMYNIPRDVLEAYVSSTYENQEKAKGAHISYTLQPKGDDLMARLSTRFNLGDLKLQISWDHLPFMQVFEKDRANNNQLTAITFEKLVNLGVPLDEVNEFCKTKFSNATSSKKA